VPFELCPVALHALGSSIVFRASFPTPRPGRYFARPKKCGREGKKIYV
jgi:hypothetical protein